MKKTILLLAAGLFAGFANAQRIEHGAPTPRPTGATVAVQDEISSASTPATDFVSAPSYTWTGVGGKTTGTGGPRWYWYVSDLMVPYQNVVRGSHVVGNNFGYILWNDTSALIGFNSSSSTPVYNPVTIISAGLGFDPTYTSTSVPGFGWNECGGIVDFTGEVAISQYDAYTIDSALVGGWYSRCTTSAPKIAVVDTLILTFMKSTRTGTTAPMPIGTLTTPAACYSVVSLSYFQLFRDIVNNRAGGNGGTTGTTTTAVYKFLMNNLDSNELSPKVGKSIFPRPGHVPADPVINFPVAANEIAAMTVTFKTGDPAYPVFPTKDTLRFTDGTSITGEKYSYWTQQSSYAAANAAAVTSTTAECPFYDPGNSLSGYWAFEGQNGTFPWHYGSYYANWRIFGVTSSGSTVPSLAQFPNIAFHTQCTTCGVVCDVSLSTKKVTDPKYITVTPNPANDKLNVSFTLAKGATATVSLTNLLGQLVASQEVVTGSADFNTSALAAGVYVYSIEVNGERSTGRVAVSH